MRKLILLISLIIATPVCLPLTQLFVWLYDGEWLPLSFWVDFYKWENL